MFESWIARRHYRARLEANALCHELVLFAEDLESHGYPPRTLRRCVFAAAAFGRWTQRHGWAIEQIDESRLHRFVVARRRYRCPGRDRGRLSDVVCGVRRFVEVLQSAKRMPQRAPVKADSPIDEMVTA
jgi:hypothetical protein